MIIPDADRFPQNYSAARARFITQAKGIAASDPSAVLSEFRVPSQRGDQDLYVDDFYLPALQTKQTLLILTSGVHGMEAYTGSAIQNMFLDQCLPHVNRKDTGVWLVHSLNPFGFKHHRRATEGNINLNRNFAASTSLFNFKNAGYERIRDFFEPRGPVRSFAFSRFQTAWFIARSLTLGGFNQSSLAEALGQGQFEHSRGAEYGGRTREPQIDHFIHRLSELIKGYHDIVLIDLHTGLGERYQLHVIPGDERRGVHPELFHRLLKPDRERDLYAWTPTSSAGFYPTHGDLNSLIPDVLNPNQRTLALTLEFGTIGNSVLDKIETIHILRCENIGYHEGYANKNVEKKVQEAFAELFFPSEQKWRENAISRARQMLLNILERLHDFNPKRSSA